MRSLRLTLAILVLTILIRCAVTPSPMKDDELVKRVADDRKRLYDGQEPITEPMTLEDAMSRALKYNLDHRLKLMEQAMAMRQTDLMKYECFRGLLQQPVTRRGTIIMPLPA